jgi:alpha-ketoglutarate-dependent taurine dioxygenase
MRNYVFTAVGRTGWHIDRLLQPAPFAYSLYCMVSVPLKVDTVFATLDYIVEDLPSTKRNEWEGLWIIIIIVIISVIIIIIIIEELDQFIL